MVVGNDRNPDGSEVRIQIVGVSVGEEGERTSVPLASFAERAIARTKH